ncbi:3-oxoacyl-(acyl-carrier-protein) reductase [Bernardetia litoralis DSM 6794]|uniref:3-oxoacyl-(Acyl-carrier-protein) reductase n=1 Tax=Bernardetia litoralis (strain ATCC 23117 / DSM 6794 / NBRC 15988 / NCIMB 1366 / Fx l1 / Sio-4) TaxID=880071 RepID=I4ANI3_BERLS|nr:acetoacetyl-CoA reductase [Bernardetia litoralis]AFM05518.1 3-oxoacyl-(acyl-carrier-protein) reductase [Bernardetia litoralis DSM 6794]
MDKDNKKVALVTGSTGGIGTAICKKLHDEGYIVVAHYRNREKAEEWSTKLKKEGYKLPLAMADVSDFDEVEKMFEDIKNGIGNVDILINNAGITQDTSFRKMSLKQWKSVIDVNLTSVFNCCRHAINPMLENSFGRIINISSVNAQRGQFGQVNYSAAKAGMHGFTKSLAMETAKKGITVNTVSPGYVATEMVMAVPENIRNQIIAQIPVGRLGTPEEIADIITYLVSDKAGFVTGANFAINGGQHVY